MNIFVLDTNPAIAAKYHFDKHAVKMCLETAQLLSTFHHVTGTAESWMYKSSHENHPCSIWIRKSSANYYWLCQLGIELCKEYTRRYNKIHKSQDIIERISKINPNIPFSPFKTNFALAMPDVCKISNTIENYEVESYRNYYLYDKFYNKDVRYKNSELPPWFRDFLVEENKKDNLSIEIQTKINNLLFPSEIIKVSTLNIKKGDLVQLSENFNSKEGQIIKYSSNKEIYIDVKSLSEILICSKEDIIKVIN